MKFSQYESELTGFLKALKTNNPTIEDQQREGRARLWDKQPISLDEQARAKESKVAQKPYVYQSNPE